MILMKFRNEQIILNNSTTNILRKLRLDSMEILKSAVNAVKPVKLVENYLKTIKRELKGHKKTLDLEQFKRIYVVGGGKACGAMAKALEETLGEKIEEGIINVLDGTENQYDLEKILLNGASHPIPDEKSVVGVRKMLSILEKATTGDLILVLISGGGSSLMTYPSEEIKLEEIQRLTENMLRSGASINELNTVRKHLSRIKGGRLVKAAYPSTVISLILSDVVDDPIDTIASGPTAPDTTTFSDAISALQKHNLWEEAPKSIRTLLETGLKGLIEETPKPGDKIFSKVHNIIVGNNYTACKAAVKRAEALGYQPLLMSTRIEGEARQVGLILSGISKEIVETQNPVPPPAAVIIGGETVVKVLGTGLGGRNQEVALSASLGIDGLDAVITALATDGIDGPTEAAGAIVDGSTLKRANSMKLEPKKYLDDNDSYNFFESLGDALITGPTGTNVNDLMTILVAGNQKNARDHKFFKDTT
jgi:glycerate-2-kinase